MFGICPAGLRESPGCHTDSGTETKSGPGAGSFCHSLEAVIQWENNGRVFSLLNSGAEYVPAGAGARDRGSRVVVADSRSRSSRRPKVEMSADRLHQEDPLRLSGAGKASFWLRTSA
uniref:Uncharacterized protein n=1 Tax=Labrus bergylta TaxID=56723 RepID=A0A3Q3F0C1_9LABR